MSDDVVLKRKSYEHLVRTRDRALREVQFERESAGHARRWAEGAFAEQRRLADRLNAVCFAAAALGVSIQVINEALDEGRPAVASVPVRCARCGDPVVWDEGNGGQWLGAAPARDFMHCGGVLEGPAHVVEDGSGVVTTGGVSEG